MSLDRHKATLPLLSPAPSHFPVSEPSPLGTQTMSKEEEVGTQSLFGRWEWEEAEGGRGCRGAVSDWVAVLPEGVVQSPASGSDGWLTGMRRGEP